MLLFTNPTDVARIVQKGVQIEFVNIGSMSYSDGKKMITNAVAVDKRDIQAFEYLTRKYRRSPPRPARSVFSFVIKPSVGLCDLLAVPLVIGDFLRNHRRQALADLIANETRCRRGHIADLVIAQGIAGDSGATVPTKDSPYAS